MFPVGMLLAALLVAPGATAVELPDSSPLMEACFDLLGRATFARDACVQALCVLLQGCVASFVCVDFTLDWNAKPGDTSIFISRLKSSVVYGVGIEGGFVGPGLYTLQYQQTPSALC
ncbi:MAG: hypothetical protein QOD77_1948 [Thermoplasmata archaeon]|nr:hypothetical protein [Thermoplasmata archaeon]